MAGMDDVRAGRILRALRVRLGWTQRQLGERCGVQQQQISLIERGHAERTPMRVVRAVFRAVDASVGWDVRWRAGALDRLLDERHASLVGAMADLLTSLGWVVLPEVTYSVFGERGSIDSVAWQASTATLVIVEVKSELTATESTLRKHDEKARLARGVVKEQFGWHPRRVARLLVLPDDRTSRRRVAGAASVLDRRYPLRGWDMRRWLSAPSGVGDGLLFLSATSPRSRSRPRTAS